VFQAATATEEILATLVGFPSVSSESNLPILDWIERYLLGCGFACKRLPNADGTKAGLLARFGPAKDGGILLSAHSDVVPVQGQRWTHEPFVLSRDGDRLFGRGTSDMKGFLASVLAMASDSSGRELKHPLMISISYDEEVGCLGIRNMLPGLFPFFNRPRWCLVGEPTNMVIATGHKGKAVYRATCMGVGGHSAMAPDYCNAIHLAADFVLALRNEQRWLQTSGVNDPAYDIGYSTVHAGMIKGGEAINVVPAMATIDFEIRHLAEEPASEILARIEAAARNIAAANHPAAAITIVEINAYPGLELPPDDPVVAEVGALLGHSKTRKVAFGTEAGYFAGLSIPTVVCGPGSMAQGHQPDEFIDELELVQFDEFLSRLLASLM